MQTHTWVRHFQLATIHDVPFNLSNLCCTIHLVSSMSFPSNSTQSISNLVHPCVVHPTCSIQLGPHLFHPTWYSISFHPSRSISFHSTQSSVHSTSNSFHPFHPTNWVHLVSSNLVPILFHPTRVIRPIPSNWLYRSIHLYPAKSVHSIQLGSSASFRPTRSICLVPTCSIQLGPHPSHSIQLVPSSQWWLSWREASRVQKFTQSSMSNIVLYLAQ